MSFVYDEINKWIPIHSEVKYEQKHKFNLQKTEGKVKWKHELVC
jgi:hypothetical protein